GGEGRSPGVGVKMDERQAVDLLVLEHMAAAAEGSVEVTLDDVEDGAPLLPSLSQPSRPVVGKINLVAGVTAARVVALDLGSTATRLACAVGDRAQIVAALPSVVAYDDDGTPLVGRPARDRALVDPRRSVGLVKRLLGRRFTEPRATDLRRSAPFPTVEAADGGIELDLGATRKPLVEVAAALVAAAREQAEKQLRRTFAEAVLAVPLGLGD